MGARSTVGDRAVWSDARDGFAGAGLSIAIGQVVDVLGPVYFGMDRIEVHGVDESSGGIE